jgi:hypothetical protein
MKNITEIHAGADILTHSRTKEYGYFDKTFSDRPHRQQQDISLDPFQRHVYQRILNNDNVFVAASPAAGKTRPVVKALLQKYIDAAVTGKLPPRVLVSVPLSQLAQQTQDDYAGIFVDLLTQKTPGYTAAQENLKMTGVVNMFPANIRDELVLLVGETYTSRQYHNLSKFISSHLIGVDTQGSPNRATSLSMIDIAVAELAAKLAKGKQYDIIVIDEVQQLFKEYPTEYDKDLKRDVTFYHTIFDKGRRAQFIFLTGSLAGNTTKDFIDHLEKFYKMKKIELLSAKTLRATPPSPNRSELRVIPYTEMGTGKFMQVPMIAKAVKDKIDNKIKYSALIIFSKKTIFQICNRLIETIQPKTIIGQTAEIQRPGREEEQKYWSFRQSFGRSTGQISSAGVPFTQRPLVKTAMGTLPREKAPKFGEFKQMQKIKVGARQFVSNELLANCLARGFGFITGGQEQNLKNDIERAMFLPYEDKKVVQDLFKTGKLSFILATDAVGIGVNMVVQHLYLPTLQKFGAGRLGPIDTSSLIQLLHRAGRGAVGTAFIYTPPENVERVTMLLSKDPTETVDIVDIDRLKNVTPLNKLLLLLKQMSQG